MITQRILDLMNRPLVDLEARTIHPFRPAAIAALIVGPAMFVMLMIAWSAGS